MKKRILVGIILLLAAVGLVGCGPKTCKEKGCDDTEIYKDGYCEWHYYENAAGDVLEEIFK